jgi:pyrophosphatase PpaX
MPSPLPAVLFDLDGTLIDSIELIVSSARHAFATVGCPAPSDADWLSGVGTPLPAMFQRWASGPVQVTELIDAYRTHQQAHHDTMVTAYDAVCDTVDALAATGHPMAIVTSKSDAMARRGLELVGLLRHFPVIVGFDSCQRHKPDPEPVHLALQRLAHPAGRAVFVGDSVHDVESGNAAGVTSIAALWGPFSRETLLQSSPDHLLDSIRDLPALLQSLR